MARAPVLLIILDGWGIRATRQGNAVALAETPNFDRVNLSMKWPMPNRSFDVDRWPECPADCKTLF